MTIVVFDQPTKREMAIVTPAQVLYSSSHNVQLNFNNEDTSDGAMEGSVTE